MISFLLLLFGMYEKGQVELYHTVPNVGRVGREGACASNFMVFREQGRQFR